MLDVTVSAATFDTSLIVSKLLNTAQERMFVASLREETCVASLIKFTFVETELAEMFVTS